MNGMFKFGKKRDKIRQKYHFLLFFQKLPWDGIPKELKNPMFC